MTASVRTAIRCLAWCLSVVIVPAAMAQDRGLAIEYTVKVADIPGQLFHVTTDIRNINQPALELSLPVWSPGWNVKRIRPVQMWPYDYARETETPLLWVSEGFTSYRAGLSLYRAGLRPAASFLGDVASAVGQVEGNEARRYIAALLGLSIRRDANGARGLDDVMRTLFADFYQRGRGFSTEDLVGVVNRISGHAYESFFSRSVSGTDVPPYETILGYAGYQVERATQKIPFLGVNLEALGRVTGFPPGFDAAASPLQVGDIILSVAGQTLEGQGAGTVFRLLNERLGQNVRLRIRRGGAERELDMTVGVVELVNHRLVEKQAPTPEQLRVRERWLKR